MSSDLDGTASVLIIGDVMLDRYLIGAVNRISPEAPVPVLRQLTDRSVAGGAANVAMNVAALGAKAELLTVIGTDAAGDELVGILRAGGVVTDRIVRSDKRPTTCKTRIVAGRQQIVRFDSEETDGIDIALQKSLLDRLQECIADVDVIILSDYAKGVLTVGLIKEILRIAKENACFSIVDPKLADFSVYKGASLIKPNRAELAKASGLPTDNSEEIDKAVAVVRGVVGDSSFLVTRSEQGMTLALPTGNNKHFPVTVTNDVADVSGAGDTVAAALAVAVGEQPDLDRAIEWALAGSSVAVGKLGTAVVTRTELLDRLAVMGGAVVHAGALADWTVAAAAVKGWQAAGENVVFANGCFDLVHPGHIRLLRQAAAQGNRLIVGLNSDQSVKRLKGPTRPIQTENNRAEVIGALRFVDLVVIFDNETPLELVTAIQPDVIVKGADYKEEDVVGGDVVRARGGRVVLVELVEGQSSSNLARNAQATA